MANNSKVLTQDERALKFFKETAKTMPDFKLNFGRKPKIMGLTELPEINSFSFIDAQLGNGERWIMKRNTETGAFTFSHYDPVGETLNTQMSLTAETPAPEIVVNPADAAAAVDRIRSELSGVVNSFCRIGYEFIQVREKQLFKVYGYKNVAEFAEKLFDLKKASMHNYIAVCEKFSRPDENGKPTAEISAAFNDFTFSQLTEIMRLPEGKAALVSPSMTCKEIRELKSGEGAETSGDKTPDVAAGEPVACTDTVNLWCRTLTKDNINEVVKLLREHIGRTINIDVEIPYLNGEEIPVKQTA